MKYVYRGVEMSERAHQFAIESGLDPVHDTVCVKRGWSQMADEQEFTTDQLYLDLMTCMCPDEEAIYDYACAIGRAAGKGEVTKRKTVVLS
jgi:hypothetical protein